MRCWRPVVYQRLREENAIHEQKRANPGAASSIDFLARLRALFPPGKQFTTVDVLNVLTTLTPAQAGRMLRVLADSGAVKQVRKGRSNSPALWVVATRTRNGRVGTMPTRPSACVPTLMPPAGR
jgi:hypothetical protein